MLRYLPLGREGFLPVNKPVIYLLIDFRVSCASFVSTVWCGESSESDESSGSGESSESGGSGESVGESKL